MNQPTGPIYIFGNGNLPFSAFLSHYAAVLDELDWKSPLQFVLCDFRGTATLAMEYLKARTSEVTVYHVGERPRYFPDKYRTKASSWKLIGGFVSDEERDMAAIKACSHFLAFDFNSNEKRKSGTLRNIEHGLQLGKIRLGAEQL